MIERIAATYAMVTAKVSGRRAASADFWRFVVESARHRMLSQCVKSHCRRTRYILIPQGETA